MGVRKALRKKAVLDATGYSNSVLYERIAEGKFPRGIKIDPESRIVIWWEDEIMEIQKLAVERAATESDEFPERAVARAKASADEFQRRALARREAESA